MKYMMIGGITLDDVVIYQGAAMFDTPGGNSIFSALGAHLWTDGIGIVSCVGPDYPQKYLTQLENHGIDVRGVCHVNVPSQHLWLLYEEDGSRQFVFHKTSSVMDSPIDATPAQIPQDYHGVKGAHLSAMGFNAQHAIAAYLVEKQIPFSYDITQASLQISGGQYAQNFATAHCRLLLPSIEEVELIYGKRRLLPLLEEIAQTGPKIISVKMGLQGSLVFDGIHHTAYQIPVFPTRAQDATGAGDAYCGGFLVGYYETGDVMEAGIYGTVSASFAVEAFGAFHLLERKPSEVVERANALRKKVERIQITGSNGWGKTT